MRKCPACRRCMAWYGSVFPIIVFAAVTRSRQFILGVDATPAALAGATIASFGIVGGSPEAMAFVR